jgi:hypothetical protein
VRRVTLVSLLLLLGLVLAGCGGGDDDAGPDAQPPAEPPATETNGAETDAAPSLPGPHPTPETCQDVPDAGEGHYEIAGIGVVVIAREGERLRLESVETVEGWQHRVDDAGDAEIEVDFLRDGERLEFEAELEDGRIEAEVCPSDD